MFTLDNIDTAIPGVVTAVNGDGTVDCKPCIRKIAPNGVFDVVNPAMPKIPLMRLGTSYVDFDFPIKEGDQVLLVAISRDAASWKKKPEDDVVPTACGGLTMNDLVAVPIVVPQKAHGASKIKVTEDGSIELVPGDSGRIWAKGDLIVEGNVDAGGDVVAGATITEQGPVETGGVSLQTHVHPTAVGPTSPPTPKVG